MMVKHEERLNGNFHELLKRLHDGVLSKRFAEYEDGSDYLHHGVLCAVRVYRRFNPLSRTYLSLTLMLTGSGEDLFVSAITTGGSIGIDALSEPGFLKHLIQIIEAYKYTE